MFRIFNNWHSSERMWHELKGKLCIRVSSKWINDCESSQASSKRPYDYGHYKCVGWNSFSSIQNSFLLKTMEKMFRSEFGLEGSENE